MIIFKIINKVIKILVLVFEGVMILENRVIVIM